MKKEYQYDPENEQQDTAEEVEIISKTRLKNEARALQEFGKILVELTPAKLKKLPLTENTRNAVNDFFKQSGNIALKRHLSYIGKCLRQDDIEALKAALAEDHFNQRREQQDASEPSPRELLLDALLEQGDSKIQEILQKHPSLDRQKFRQLLRNVISAKTDVKKKAATGKLKAFIHDNNLS